MNGHEEESLAREGLPEEFSQMQWAQRCSIHLCLCLFLLRILRVQRQYVCVKGEEGREATADTFLQCFRRGHSERAHVVLLRVFRNLPQLVSFWAVALTIFESQIPWEAEVREHSPPPEKCVLNIKCARNFGYPWACWSLSRGFLCSNVKKFWGHNNSNIAI